MAQKVARVRKMKSRQETTPLSQIASVTAKPTISDKHLWTPTRDVLKFRWATWDSPTPPWQGLQKTGIIMLAEIQDLVSVQMIIYHWVVMLSLLILSSSSFLINIILELWIVAKRTPAYVAYITVVILLQIIPHSTVHIWLSYIHNFMGL